MSEARNRTNAAWLRAQLEDLRFTLSIRVVPHAELRTTIDAILAGRVRGATAEPQPMTQGEINAELAKYRSTKR